MSRIFFLLSFFALNVQNAFAEIKPIIILVPGTFNSLLGDYFSESIQNIFKQTGFNVHIARGFSPLGSYEKNGARLADVLDQQCRPMTWVVGHSAGALYSLAAIKKSSCRVTGLISIGAPLKGSEWASAIKSTWWGRYVWMFLPFSPIEAGIVRNFLPESMKGFYNTLDPMPYRFHWWSYAGQQPLPQKQRDYGDAEFVSPYMSTLPYVEMNDPGDGAVSVQSALGAGIALRVADQSKVEIQPFSEIIPLDHQEQFRNVEWINPFFKNNPAVMSKQNKFYSDLANRIKSLR